MRDNVRDIDELVGFMKATGISHLAVGPERRGTSTQIVDDGIGRGLFQVVRGSDYEKEPVVLRAMWD